MTAPFRIVQRAHWDDIHGFTPFGTDFISGSKDGSLKRWSEKGELVSVIRDIAKVEDGSLDYTRWVTALCTVGKRTWVSGFRSGQISQWTERGLRSMPLRHDNRPHCKPRNEDRITFLAADSLSEENGVIFVGQAREFCLVHLEKGLLKRVTLSRNDWTYGLAPAFDGHKIAIVGTALHLLSQKIGWKSREVLYDDRRVFDRERGHRPYISCLTPIVGENRKFAFGVFDGAVKTIDLEKVNEVSTVGNHVNRVWSVNSLDPNRLLSSGDDRYIRLWDLRTPENAVMTLGPDVGRVSCIHLLSENIFVAGSCPDRPSIRVPSARMSFWDLRR